MKFILGYIVVFHFIISQMAAQVHLWPSDFKCYLNIYWIFVGTWISVWAFYSVLLLCLFMHHYHTILIIGILYYVLMLGKSNPPLHFLFVCLVSFFFFPGNSYMLVFHGNFRINFSNPILKPGSVFLGVASQ